MILVVNAGSSSVKVAGYNTSNGKQTYKTTINTVTTYKLALKQALADVRGNVVGIGYRVVHGGQYKTAQVVMPEVLEAIVAAAKYAPLHNPPAVEAITILQKLYPHAKHVAVFDTAFFAVLPERTTSYALPEGLRQEYRRVGYHGISHQNVANQYPYGDVISVHLGSGCSVAALENGQPVDTSMGFGTYDGVVMGTRSGQIDPEVVLDLARRFGVDEARTILTTKSGMAGVAEMPNDFRAIWETALNGNDQGQAMTAFALFTRSVAKNIGALLTAFEPAGSNAKVVFTGGIAENSLSMRDAVMVRLGGLVNQDYAVVKCDEEHVIYEIVKGLLK